MRAPCKTRSNDFTDALSLGTIDGKEQEHKPIKATLNR